MYFILCVLIQSILATQVVDYTFYSDPSCVTLNYDYIISIPPTCMTDTGSHSSNIVTCDTTQGLVSKICSDTACSKGCNATTTPVGVCINSETSSMKVACESALPTQYPPNSFIGVSYTNDACTTTSSNPTGMNIIHIGTCLPSPDGTPSSFLSYQCDSSFMYKATCTDSACKQCGTTTKQTLGCISEVGRSNYYICNCM